MTDAQRIALSLVSKLLSYPDSTFMSKLDILLKQAETLVQDRDTREFGEAAISFITDLKKSDPAESGQRYVAIFDHTPSASLHMAWHRYGNDRSQGKAMAALNGLYRTAGFEPLEGQMPDYLPRMLEFFAVAPDWACEALLDGFGAELSGLLKTLSELGADQTLILKLALTPLLKEYPELFKPRPKYDSTKRPMAKPDPEPLKPLIPVPPKSSNYNSSDFGQSRE